MGQTTDRDKLQSSPLTNPTAFTVDEVAAALADASDTQIAEVKALEQGGAGGGRKGVLEWERAVADTDEDPPVERYFPSGWRERARSRFGISPHLLAGALYAIPADQPLSENEVRALIKESEAA